MFGEFGEQTLPKTCLAVCLWYISIYFLKLKSEYVVCAENQSPRYIAKPWTPGTRNWSVCQNQVRETQRATVPWPCWLYRFTIFRSSQHCLWPYLAWRSTTRCLPCRPWSALPRAWAWDPLPVPSTTLSASFKEGFQKLTSTKDLNIVKKRMTKEIRPKAKNIRKWSLNSQSTWSIS